MPISLKCFLQNCAGFPKMFVTKSCFCHNTSFALTPSYFAISSLLYFCHRISYLFLISSIKLKILGILLIFSFWRFISQKKLGHTISLICPNLVGTIFLTQPLFVQKHEINTKTYEIKYSNKVILEQAKHLLNKEKCKII